MILLCRTVFVLGQGIRWCILLCAFLDWQGEKAHVSATAIALSSSYYCTLKTVSSPHQITRTDCHKGLSQNCRSATAIRSLHCIAIALP